jgi:hypothetical protein
MKLFSQNYGRRIASTEQPLKFTPVKKDCGGRALWDQKTDDFLRMLCERKYEYKEMALRLGITLGQVQARMKYLGLTVRAKTPKTTTPTPAKKTHCSVVTVGVDHTGPLKGPFMDFVSEDERQSHAERRIAIYNRLQTALAGSEPLAAVEAVCDTLAVAVVQICGAERQASQDLLDKLFPSIKRCADNNLDLVAEQMKLNAAANAAARNAGIQ